MKMYVLCLVGLLSLFLINQSKQFTQSDDSILIGFGGDTMLGRLVNETLKKKDAQYIWGNLLEDLRATDLNIINLENVFTKSEKPVQKVFNFKSDPEHVSVLQHARIDVVNLANNHVLDFGVEGLRDTISILDNVGIKHVGAGNNIVQARKPVVIEKSGIRIGILGWTDNESSWNAAKFKPGTNYYSVGSIMRLKRDIRMLKKRVDIVIVSMHWGPNMRQRPTEQFRKAAYELIGAGADILHGHSAHIFQGIEITKENKLILYDTGDLVDDYQVDPELRNDQSFLFLVRIDKHGVISLELIPTLISHMQVNKVSLQHGQKQIKRIIELSKEFLTKLNPDGSWSRTQVAEK